MITRYTYRLLTVLLAVGCMALTSCRSVNPIININIPNNAPLSAADTCPNQDGYEVDASECAEFNSYAKGGF